jgi:hypothetical protein
MLLQVFTDVMNQPTAQTFRTLVVGWLLAPRRTVMGMVRASGIERHHASFHRLFAAAKWSVDQVGLRLFDLITRGESKVFLSVDDTLLPRTGLKVWGTGMHRDPMLSSRGFHVTRWGHCRVVLCVVIESRHFPGKRFALPILSRLYLNKSSAQKWRRTYRKKNDLMIEMLRLLDKHLAGSEKTLHLLGDAAFTAPVVLNDIPASIEVTGRLNADARLHERTPQHQSGQVGRPRKRGVRLPNPLELLSRKGLRRLTLTPYESSTQKVRLAVIDACTYKAPDRLVRVVAIEHLTGGRGVEVFYSTEVDVDAEQILEQYSWRWPIEITFQDVKQHLGAEEPENRTRRAVERTAATGFLLYSLIVWWHETACAQPAQPIRNWKKKSRSSFADILGELRQQTLQTQSETNLSTPGIPPGVKKYVNALTRLIALAA